MIRITTQTRCNNWLAACGVHAVLLGIWCMGVLMSHDTTVYLPPATAPARTHVSTPQVEITRIRQAHERARKQETVAQRQDRQSQDQGETSSGDRPEHRRTDQAANQQQVQSTSAQPGVSVQQGPDSRRQALGRGPGAGGGHAGNEGACDWSALPTWGAVQDVVREQGWSLLMVTNSNTMSVVVRGDMDGQLRDITADVRRLLPIGIERALIRMPVARANQIMESQRLWTWRTHDGRWSLE